MAFPAKGTEFVGGILLCLGLFTRISLVPHCHRYSRIHTRVTVVLVPLTFPFGPRTVVFFHGYLISSWPGSSNSPSSPPFDTSRVHSLDIAEREGRC